MMKLIELAPSRNRNYKLTDIKVGDTLIHQTGREFIVKVNNLRKSSISHATGYLILKKKNGQQVHVTADELAGSHWTLEKKLRESEVVKNKKTGNVYKVSKFDASKHARPTPKEIDKAKKDGSLPNNTDAKPKGQSVFSSQAKTVKLKDLMPGMDTSKKSIVDVDPMERQKISTIIDKLAELGNQAKAAGEKAPNFNLCKVTIPGTNLYCDGNKGISRQDMPQFKGSPAEGSPASKLPKDRNGEVDTEKFFEKMLKEKGTKVSSPVKVSADKLKATQSELVGVKVAGMSKVLADKKHPAYKAITNPIYVSNDGYVLDGHHRWAAIIAHNASNPNDQIPMRVKVIDESIIPLVHLSNKFAETIGIKAKAADASVKEVISKLGSLLNIINFR